MPKKDCRFHLVLVTKYRYKIFSDEVSKYISESLEKWSKTLEINILECSTEADHTHLAFEYNGVAVEEIVGKIKGRLAFALHKKFPKLRRNTIWSEGYYLGTMGEVSSKNIAEYIRSQGFRETETVERTFKLKVLPSSGKNVIMEQFVEGVRTKDPSKAPAAMLQRTEGLPENSFKLRMDLTKFKAVGNKLSDYAVKVGGGKKCGIKSFWLALKSNRDLPAKFSPRDSYIRKTPKGWFVYLVAREERILKRFSPQSVMSIDFGIKHPVTSVACADGQIKKAAFWGREIKRQIWLREKRRSELQSASEKRGWNISPKATIKYQRRIDDLIHKFTKSFVELAKESGSSIAVGNLLNVRNKSKHCFGSKSANKSNYNLHKMPFGKLKDLLQYKAKLLGVPLLFVDEAYTSQKCSKCGYTHSDNRNGRHFRCGKCGHSNHADMNGAMNIAASACQLSGYDTALSFADNTISSLAKNGDSRTSKKVSPMANLFLGNPIL